MGFIIPTFSQLKDQANILIFKADVLIFLIAYFSHVGINI